MPLPTEKVEKLGLFLSQQFGYHMALASRDFRIGEELLEQRNIFLADKYVEGHHHASPTLRRRITVSAKVPNWLADADARK